MNTSSPRLSAIDGMRAMAMLMVFWYHAWEFAGTPSWGPQVGSHHVELLGRLGVGAAGVDVFMVLSGFCLFFPFCTRPERLETFDIKNYALRRVRRIVPPYYAAIAYALLLRGLFPALPGKSAGEAAR